MQDLTFGEQVKIVLSRKNMTIKELARKIELRTKKKMSRQNLTQRLGRDNFQEQDMRMIAEILGCSFHLDILGEGMAAEKEETQGVTAALENGEKKEQTEKAGGELPGGQTAAVQAEEAAEETPEEIQEVTAEEPAEKTPETAVHERDITIGELVDIHEELDAMIEKAASEHPEQGIHTADRPADQAGRDTLEVQVQVTEMEAAEDISSEEGEPVEKLLEEIESMEKENRREERPEEKAETQEKPHGWRSYFMQRLKKRGKEQPDHDETGQADRNAAAETVPAASETGYLAGEPERVYGGEEYQEGNYLEERYPEGSYGSDRYAEGGYQESGYPEGRYAQGSYQERGYSEGGYQESGYEGDGYSENDREVPQAEELGERNPYTGKEYETNSVRMHPSRIGYVQVYDRSNHQWMDMTEWAFLGYQERKKQLLGKDYDPPIYLD